MFVNDVMTKDAPYSGGYDQIPYELRVRAKRLCWEFNQSAPDEEEQRASSRRGTRAG